jgi:NAD+ diphosphatase
MRKSVRSLFVDSLMNDLPLARFTVDRLAELRSNPQWFEQAWASETTRVLVLHDRNIPVTAELSIVWVKPWSLKMDSAEARQVAVFLGADDDHTYIAIMEDEVGLTDVNWASLRDVGAALSAKDVGLATSAIALAAWHEGHQFCPKCGAKTEVATAGWSRKCNVHDSEHYPRTEPAMIVAVEDLAGRILLGRRREWPEGWLSTLAGFVEAGESCEAAVIREVYEESGIHVDLQSLKYMGSQPWPFPASLMLAYRAVATSTEVEMHDEEMTEVQWFSRDELFAACEAQTLKLPSPVSIAFRLIQSWYGEDIPIKWCRS